MFPGRRAGQRIAHWSLSSLSHLPSPHFHFLFFPVFVCFVTLFVLVLALLVWRVGCWSSGLPLKVLGVGGLGLLARFAGSHGVSLRGSLTEEGSVSAVPPRMLGPCGFGCLDQVGPYGFGCMDQSNSFPCLEPNAPGDQRRVLFGGPLTEAPCRSFL